jgi:hypothetical protein
MSRIINLPSGQTATLRDPKTLKQKDRARIFKAGANGDGMDIMDTLISILVEEWSFDLILPSVKIEMLGELDIPDYDLLVKEAESAQNVLFPDLSQPLGKDVDPKAATPNFNA